MKYIIYTIFPPIILFLFIGCHSQNNKKDNTLLEVKNISTIADSIILIESAIFPIIIDKNKDYENKGLINLQDIADVDYTKLETTNECLLTSKNLLKGVYFDENNIFLSTTESVLRFNRNGKFVNSIGKKGQGPNEINLLVDFKINKNTKEVFILDAASYNIKVFDYDGNGKQSIHNKIYSDRISIMNDSIILCGNNLPNNRPMIFSISKKTGELKTQLSSPRTKKTGLSYFVTTYYTENKTYNKQTIFNTNITDTIFSVNDSTLEVKSRYIQLPPNTGSGNSNSSFFIIFETNRYANILSLKDREAINSTYVIDKKKNEIYKGLFIDSNSRIITLPINSNEDNILVELYESFDLQKRLSEGKLSGKIKEIAETVKDEDNPVLMIATVKF